MHGVEQNADAGVPDGFNVEAGEDRIEEAVEGGFEVDHLPGGDRAGKTGRADGCAGDEFFEVGRAFHGSVAALFHDQFDAVIGGGVVARGDLNAVVQALVLDREHDQRRGGAAVHEPDGGAVGDQDLGHPAGGVLGEKAAVVADHHRLVRFAFLGHQVGNALGHPADVFFGETVADHVAPATRSEFDHIIHLLCKWDLCFDYKSKSRKMVSQNGHFFF